MAFVDVSSPGSPQSTVKLLLKLYPLMSQRYLRLQCAKVNLSAPSFLLPAFIDTVNDTSLHQIAQVLSDSPTIPHIIQSIINPHDSGYQLSLKSSHFSPAPSPIFLCQSHFYKIELRLHIFSALNLSMASLCPSDNKVQPFNMV